jgi:hypothetical protein
MPYPEVNTLFDGLLPWGLRHYWKSTVAREIDADAAARFVAHGRETPTIESGIFFYHVDGAAHDVGADDTAWPYRDARYVVGIHGSWNHARDDAALRGWVERAHGACVPAGSPAGYVNFSSDDDAPPATLYRRHTSRLVSVKRQWDRHNLFCLNANLDPDGPAEA